MKKMEGESWDRLVEEFALAGSTLFAAGLNNSHSGNLSVRLGGRLVITRRGSMLGRLSTEDLVSVGLDEDDSGIALASTEVNVHRSIYRSTSALAVVHTHPRSATALSLSGRDIVPVDVEGRYYFKRVPVLGVKRAIGSEELESELPVLLKDFPIVVVKGHGAFAVGGSLEEGLQISHSLEWSCDIILRCAALGLSVKDLLSDEKHGDW